MTFKLITLATIAGWIGTWAAAASIEAIPTGLGQFGSMGILAWYAYYTTTKTIPDLIKENREQQERERRAFQEELEKHRAHDKEQVKTLEDTLNREMKAMVASVHELTKAMRTDE